MLTRLSALSNACFFNMGARLARFTGNSTFADYSEETWNWLTSVGFIDNETWAVYDGAFVEDNCTDILQGQWSANAASLTQGAAFMYNYVSPQSSIKSRRKTADTATPPRPTAPTPGASAPRSSPTLCSRPSSRTASPTSRPARGPSCRARWMCSS